jgi:hypothetical protein
VTAKTRHRLIFGLVVVALTLPAESILIKALSAEDAQQAVTQWASGLPPETLEGAAAQIQSFPFAYRRAIMAALSPERRSQVWRHHIAMYIGDHPELDAAAVAALQAAIDVASPEAFASPTAETRAQVDAVGNQVVALIGRDAAEYVLYRLGPRDGTFASLEPTSERLANFVRGTFVLLARTRECDCNMDWGCAGYFVHCQDNTGCPPDNDWPMCGWLWNMVCDGLCYSGIAG